MLHAHADSSTTAPRSPQCLLICAGKGVLAACDTTTTEGKRRAAGLRSSSGGAASAWLDPAHGALRVSDEAFTTAGRHRVGLGLQSSVEPLPCTCTGGDAARPDHAMVCGHCSGERNLRHNIEAAAWRHCIRRAGCAVSAEPYYAGARAAHAPLAGDERARRGDIVAVMPGGSLIVADVVVTHAQAASYVDAAAHTTGATAAAAERRKRNALADIVESGGYDFWPLATESHGLHGKSARSFVSKLGKIAERGGVSRAAFVRSVYQELSMALVRGQALVYDASLERTARAIGRAFEHGSRVVLEDACGEF